MIAQRDIPVKDRAKYNEEAGLLTGARILTALKDILGKDMDLSALIDRWSLKYF